MHTHAHNMHRHTDTHACTHIYTGAQHTHMPTTYNIRTHMHSHKHDTCAHTQMHMHTHTHALRC